MNNNTPLRLALSANETKQSNVKSYKPRSLSNDIQDISKQSKLMDKWVNSGRIAMALRNLPRMEMDDEAVEIMIGLANTDSKGIKTLLDNAFPLHDRLWVEWGSNTFVKISGTIEELERRLGPNSQEIANVKSRSEHCRTGMLIEKISGTDWISISMMEHLNTPPGWMAWPVFVVINTGETPLDRQNAKGHVFENGSIIDIGNKSGKRAFSLQAQAWGLNSNNAELSTLERERYSKRALGRISNKVHIGLSPELTLYSVDMEEEGKIHFIADFIGSALADIGGIAKIAIAFLSMLNTPTSIVTKSSNFEGRRMLSKGKSVPQLGTSKLRISVPRRVVKVLDYVRKEIKQSGIKKRLHEVSPHYRHLSHQPKTSGWQEITIDGEQFWRKRISAHLRGDPDIGVIEHEITLVKGS